MGNEQTALSFGKGITNVPSDAICDDNALEECMGMVFDDGEHRVIQKPIALNVTIGGTLLFVHIVSGQSRYIYLDGANLKWKDGQDNGTIGAYGSNTKVNAVNGILVISHSRGISYARWEENGYQIIDEIPEFTFIPKMVDWFADGYHPSVDLEVVHVNLESGVYGIGHETKYIDDDGTVYESKPREMSTYYNTRQYIMSNETDKRKSFQDYVTAAFEADINEFHKAGAFSFPFWVRFAVELFDGSITHHSAPIICWPSVRYGTSFIQCYDNGGNISQEAHDADLWNHFKSQLNRSFLEFKIKCSNMPNLKDIVKSIKVYVSREVRTAYTNEDKWKFYNAMDEEQHYSWDKVNAGASGLLSYYQRSDLMDTMPNAVGGTGVKNFYHSYIYAEQKSDTEIIKDLVDNCDVFYELCEIPYDIIANEIDNLGSLDFNIKALDYMEHNCLVNLTTRTQMEHDDYYSHTNNVAGGMYVYNSRLNIYDIQRTMFKGFDVFSAESTDPTTLFRIEVTVRTEQGSLTTHREFLSPTAQGYFFYYPDERATHAKLFYKKNGAQQWYFLQELTLTPHKSLNGAYYFGMLPYDTGSILDGFEMEFTDDRHYSGTTCTTDDFTDRNDKEDVVGLIMTSEVNNPMVFYAEGSNIIGIGRILGLAAQTVALSSGTPFGSQPLIVFTENGLWAMSVSKTGLYDSINPMPREVCNNTDSITPVDGAVFFSSEKGLMVTAGSAAKCVSEQLSGKSAASFATFLKTAVIAYDYRDSLLWIFNRTSTVCWIYNIKSGTFAHYDFGTGNVVTNVVNDYPDYLLQIGSSIYSLLRRPNINDDGVTVNSVFTANTYSGQIITRPMKFDNALALKSIMQIMTVKQMEGSMTYRLFASNDLQSWVELSSLRGMPWKYYKLQFDFSRLKATDRFGGAVIVTQERRTNKLR